MTTHHSPLFKACCDSIRIAIGASSIDYAAGFRHSMAKKFRDLAGILGEEWVVEA